MDMLNEDCLLLIFQHLSLKEKIKCERVCKYWREISKKSWSCLKRLDMFTLVRELKDRKPWIEDMEFLLSKTTGALSTLNLSDCSFPDMEQDLSHILSLAPKNLTTLIINDLFEPIIKKEVLQTILRRFRHLKNLTLRQTEFEDDSLQVLLRNLPELETLNLSRNRLPVDMLSHCANLRKLNITQCSLVSPFDLYTKVPPPSLEVPKDESITTLLSMRDGSTELLTELSVSTDLINADGVNARIPCPNLKHLTLTVSLYAYEFKLDFSDFSNLEELIVESAMFFLKNPANMKSVARHCPKLKKLSVEYIEDEDEVSRNTSPMDYHTDFFSQAAKLTNLEYLNISYFLCDMDQMLVDVASLKKLKTLIMRTFTGRLAPEDLTKLLSKLANLRHLDICGAQILRADTDVETFLLAVESEPEANKPEIEIVLGKCGLPIDEVTRVGRFKVLNENRRIPSDDDSDNCSFDYEEMFYHHFIDFGIDDDWSDYSEEDFDDHFLDFQEFY